METLYNVVDIVQKRSLAYIAKYEYTQIYVHKASIYIEIMFCMFFLFNVCVTLFTLV